MGTDEFGESRALRDSAGERTRLACAPQIGCRVAIYRSNAGSLMSGSLAISFAEDVTR